MPSIIDYYSINEVKKPPHDRVRHNNSGCSEGSKIPNYDRRPGTNGYQVCVECAKLNALGR